MFERSLQPDNMFFVIRVGLLKLIQHLYFLETRFVPKKKDQMGVNARVGVSLHGLLAPDDLDSDLPTNICKFPANDPSTHHVGKHAFSEGRENLIASAIKLFTEDHRVIPFWIRSRVQRGRDESGSGRFLRDSQ